MKRTDFNFAHSAQGVMKHSEASSACGAACGTGDKPATDGNSCQQHKTEEKPAACGSACGTGDKEEKPTACGAGDK